MIERFTVSVDTCLSRLSTKNAQVSEKCWVYALHPANTSQCNKLQKTEVVRWPVFDFLASTIVNIKGSGLCIARLVIFAVFLAAVICGQYMSLP